MDDWATPYRNQRNQWRRILHAFAIGCVLGLLWLWVYQAFTPRIPEKLEGLKGIPGKTIWVEPSSERKAQ